ncbi:MAG: MBL fold metallo-hydrolase [Deltaproteobacteria bacterium]|nr:MBL fold metallo-hydrolase [Deltaproteobacteria bacterium]
MPYRISPAWWPFLAITSPVTLPLLLVRNRRFQKGREEVAGLNRQRIDRAEPLELPELDFLELTVLVEWKREQGFLGDAGVSYLFKNNLGSMLFDIGFGPDRPAFVHNAEKLGFHLDQVDALTISHLHCDHMGGISAQRSLKVTVPEKLLPTRHIPCFLPDMATAEGFDARLIERPQLLAAGIASTGPLARRLFMLGHTEEQALVARVKGKGLIVFTGCGHPTIEVILEMVSRLSDEPLHAVGGGLHFPVTEGRGNRAGIKIQMLFGTGKPPWQRITDEDLSRTIAAINDAGPEEVYLSGHDTCDHALDRMIKELTAATIVLKAGATYRL